MKTLKKNSVLIYLIITLLPLQDLYSQGMPAQYSVEINNYEYDVLAKKTILKGKVGVIFDDQNFTQAQFRTIKNVNSGKVHVGSGVGTKPFYHRFYSLAKDSKIKSSRMNNLLNDKESKGGALLLKQTDLVLHLKLKNVKEEKHIDKVIYLFESRSLKSKTDDENLYKIDSYKIENSIAEKDWINGSPKIKFKEPLESRNLHKMVTYEDSENVFYSTFKYKMSFSLDGTFDEEDDEYISEIDVEEIHTPFSFDIKYDNILNLDKTAKGIKQNEEFFFEAYKRKVPEVQGDKIKEVTYKVKGKIIPYSYKNDILKVQLLLRFVHQYESSEFVTSLSRYVEFEKDDVIELKVPVSQPRYSSLSEAEIEKLDHEFKFYNELLQNQSLIIRPVKVE